MQSRMLGLGILLFAALGCSGSPGKAETVCLALDTSGSAKASQDEFFARARQEIMGLTEDSKVYMYRFDSSPAESYSGPPPHSEEQASEYLRTMISHSSSTSGTKLNKLIVLMDRVLSQSTLPARAIIFTDCGTEEMSKAEKDQVARITERWEKNDLIESVQFIGVKDGSRETLREMVKLADEKFSIEK